jgi:glucose/arabinose dehydrogenase
MGVRRIGVVATSLLAVGVLLAACQPPLTPPPPNSPTLGVQRNFITGLSHPWDMGFAADGTMFFTQRSGEISVRLTNGTVRLLLDLPDTVVIGEAGMLGLAVDPNFAANRRIYTCTSSNVSGSNDVRVIRWTVSAGLDQLQNRSDIVPGIPFANGHTGCRPRFGPDGFLYVTTGDAGVGTNPQSGSSLGGKVLRVDANGAAAPGNNPPGGFDDRIYNYGHRNVQGLAFRPGDSFGVSVEHGPDRDDEANRVLNGANYGWDPVPGYNQTVPMTDKNKFPNAVSPIWTSGNVTNAPSGATFLSGPQWRSWDGALAMAVLKDRQLRLLFIGANGALTRQSLADLGAGVPRLRSAVQGPDGNLYLATDVPNGGGAIWRVVPS